MRPTTMRAATVLVFALIAFVWGANSRGIVSSNDGSHVALGRALGAGQTTIDADVALTLGVDAAKRDEHWFSDRPPGTGASAVPALWIGRALDPALLRASQRAGELVLAPGSDPFIFTYAKRFEGAPPLAARIGTGTAAALWAMALGLAGLACVWVWIRRRGLDESSALLGVAGLGLASLYGPYSTTLFAHVGAAAALGAGIAWATLEPTARSNRQRVASGVALGLAVTFDYSLALASAAIFFALFQPREWSRVLMGAVPVALLLGAYHTFAFGDPLAIGYDHQTNFEFARDRSSTFSGRPWEGAWVLFGGGRGAGLAWQSPLAAAGVLGLAMWGELRERRLLLALAPWLVLLCFHQTPWGGVGEDHRYLVPLLPLAAMGLARAWDRAGRAQRGLLGVVGVISAGLVWSHFLSWHDAPAFGQPIVGAIAALPAAGLGWALTRERSRLSA